MAHRKYESLIHSEFQNIIQKYKNQLEEVTSTLAMLQQYLINLKQENLNLQAKTRKDWQDLKKYCEENEQYDRRLFLTIKNMKKQESESSGKVLEAVKCLLSEVRINTKMSALIVYIALAELVYTVIVRFTTFVTALCFTGKGRNWKMEWKFTFI